MTNFSIIKSPLAPLMAADPTSEMEAREYHKSLKPTSHSDGAAHIQHQHVAPSPPQWPDRSISDQDLVISGNPITVLKVLSKKPEEWRSWGLTVRHLSGLELELRSGFAKFTENSKISFPMSLVESFFLGRRIDRLLRNLACRGLTSGGLSRGAALSLLCRSMRREPDAWDVGRGAARHRDSGAEIWFVEDDLSVAGFTPHSALRFELNPLQRWRLWRAARYLSRQQAAKDLVSKLYRSQV